MTDKETIRAEIERRYAEYRAKMKTDDFTYYEGMADALDLFEQFLDTIPEQPVEGLEEECERFYRTDEYKMAHNLGRGFETIARHFYELGCRHTAEKFDEIEYKRQREEEQTCKGFEKEFSRFIKKEKEEEPDGSLPSYGDYGIYRIARHFAEWGAGRGITITTDEPSNKTLEKVAAAMWSLVHSGVDKIIIQIREK